MIERSLPDFLSDIIRIPSYSGQESGVARRIEAEMLRVGFDEVRIDRFGNVLGRIGSGPRLIAMDGHIDTVEIGNRDSWDFDPFSGEIRDGYIWGRGASDQKAGIAALVYAGYLMRSFQKELLPEEFTILITGTVSEEDCDGLCWRYLIEKESIRPELCVITEPTDGTIYRGQRGRVEISARMPGISAHGSAPERGVNAITRMADIVTSISDLSGTLPLDEFLGRGSITVSRITSAAPSLCSVPDSCEIYLDRRLTWGETPAAALEQIRALDSTGEMQVEIPEFTAPTHRGFVYPVLKEYPAWKTDPSHPAITAAMDAFESLFERKPEIGRWIFSTNGVAISGIYGIPCIGFGPGREEWAHAPNERVAIDQLYQAALFYAFYPQYYHRQRER